MLSMKLREVLIRQVRNIFGVAPRFKPIGCRGKKRVCQLAVYTTFRIGKFAFHFIEHHAFINNFILRAV